MMAAVVGCGGGGVFRYRIDGLSVKKKQFINNFLFE